MNSDTGEIRRWDSLTEDEQKSGKWLKLPTHDENGEPAMCERAKPKSLLAEMFSTRAEQRGPRQALEDSAKRGSFDALGRPR